jgi:hypothetical protein
METRLTLVAGRNGTRKLAATYGDKLVCVRYRYDAAGQLRHKTVELIVETTPWRPRSRNARRRPRDMVSVRIAYSEAELRERIKRWAGIWRPWHELWEIDWKTVCRFGLQSRVVDEPDEIPIQPWIYARRCRYKPIDACLCPCGDLRFSPCDLFPAAQLSVDWE